MAKMLIQSESLTAIADKIRVLSGTEEAMSLNAMENHVGEANEEVDSQADLISQIANALDGKAGGGEAVEITLQSKTVTPSTSVQTVTADSGYDGLDEVTVNAIPSNYIVPTGTLPITSNGTYDVKNYASCEVNVAGSGGDGGSGEQAEWSANEDAALTGTLSVYTNDRITSLRNGVFNECTKLKSVDFPLVATIGAEAFYKCTNLSSASFPVATTIGSSAFYYCSKLTTISLPKAANIYNSAFYRGVNLKSLYLTGSSLCALKNSNAFTSTPIGGYTASAGTTGSIYVPASMLASYQAATNWTYFSNRMVGI